MSVTTWRLQPDLPNPQVGAYTAPQGLGTLPPLC